MKRVLPLFLAMTVSLMLLCADSNDQKVYPVSDPVYDAVKGLYLLDGRALPSTTGPWSASEISMMLGKIRYDGLCDYGRTLYDGVLGRLGKSPLVDAKRLGMDFGLIASPEVYFHTAEGNLGWGYGQQDRRGFLTAPWETWGGGFMYSYFEFQLRNTLHAGSSNDEDIGFQKLAVNLPALQNLKFNGYHIDMNFPYRAFFSLGGDFWSLQVGRDRLNWGAGVTGNMVISDNLAYQNLARFTAFEESFKYTFLLSFFPHPKNYIKPNFKPYGYGQNKPVDGLSFYMAHRLEARLFNDRLNLTATEAIMYMSEDGALDLRVLNPVMLFHNYYLRANSNSTFALEADCTPMKGLNIYAQFILDEINTRSEGNGTSSSPSYPTCMGYLAGIQFVTPLGTGLLDVGAEAARTDPFLYLRDAGSTANQSAGQYGINYVVALRTFTSWNGVTYDEHFLGYRYGGDAQVLNLKAGWGVAGRFSLNANIFLMAHGTFDKWTCWTKVATGDPSSPEYDDCLTPTSTHDKVQNHRGDVSGRDSVEYTTVAGLNFGYWFTSKASAFIQADFMDIRNPGNVSSNEAVRDLQLTVGCTYSL